MTSFPIVMWRLWTNHLINVELNYPRHFQENQNKSFVVTLSNVTDRLIIEFLCFGMHLNAEFCVKFCFQIAAVSKWNLKHFLAERAGPSWIALYASCSFTRGPDLKMNGLQLTVGSAMAAKVLLGFWWNSFNNFLQELDFKTRDFTELESKFKCCEELLKQRDELIKVRLVFFFSILPLSRHHKQHTSAVG